MDEANKMYSTATSLLAKNAQLATKVERLSVALEDLLKIIAVDELIPESVSYMVQARAAVAYAKTDI